MTHRLADNENFDIVRGNQTVRVPFDATDPETPQTARLAREDELARLDTRLTAVEGAVQPPDLTPYARKDEMSVTNSLDSTTQTITLKNGLSVRVVTRHQDISGKADAADLRYALYAVPQAASTEWIVDWTPTSENPSSSASVVWVDGYGWQLNGSYDGQFLGGDETSTRFEGTAEDIGIATYVATRVPVNVLHDRAVNVIFCTGETLLELVFPSAVPDRVRDFIVRLVVANAVDAPALTLPFGTYEAPDGELPDLSQLGGGGTMLIYFSEVAANRFYVKSEVVEEVAL